ncbi:orf27 [Alcelaphine gammaherpesvirus 2]|uniref:Orf27 n=1 Tax=Alcelaphine gammaherpesvirus 2 TaxID=138184 RepID=A0A068A9W8_9GAMA|nr:orf27 [Alcelaphine gammaherpesvirus 2]AIA62064.1 orf27 [Alcelaphine gammaherpesvirus 2]
MVGIQRLIKHDDGTVQEVSFTADGWVKETYYKKNTPVKPASDPVAKYGEELRPTHQVLYRRPSYQQLFFYLLYWWTYLTIMVLLAFPLNPYNISRSFQFIVGPASYPINCNRASPDKYSHSCFSSFFCTWDIMMPEIKVNNETFYPNFTKSDGQPADYSSALFWATSFVTNPNCTNFTVLHSNSTHSSYYNNSGYEVAKQVMLEGLFMLRHKCHPETVYLGRSRCGAYRWRFVDVYDTSYLNHSTCSFDWVGLSNATYSPQLGPNCSLTALTDEELESGLFVQVQQVEIKI